MPLIYGIHKRSAAFNTILVLKWRGTAMYHQSLHHLYRAYLQVSILHHQGVHQLPIYQHTLKLTYIYKKL